MKLAVQLYSVREDAARDFVGTLERLAALGLDGVEFAGYHGVPAEVLHATLDRLGLAAASAHVGLDLLETDLPNQIACAKTLGMRYVVCPGAHVSTQEDILALVVRLNAIAAKLAAEGLVLGYHNHAHEFFPVDGAASGLELLYAGTAAAGVVGEVDTHWVQRGKRNPRAFLAQHAGQVPLVHIKDLDASGETDAAVGEGVMDIRGIWEAAEAAGAEWAVVELDTASFDNIAIGVKNLRKLGLVR
jgi:sugar phosphate isomerase/epimerase